MYSAWAVAEYVGEAQVVGEQPDDRQPHLGALQPGMCAVVAAVGCERETGTVDPPAEDGGEHPLSPSAALGATEVCLLAGQPKRVDDVEHVAGVEAVAAENSLVLRVGEQGPDRRLGVRQRQAVLRVGAAREAVEPVDHLEPAVVGMRAAPHAGLGVGSRGQPAHEGEELLLGLSMVVEVSGDRGAEGIDRRACAPGIPCPWQVVQLVRCHVDANWVLEATAEELQGVAGAEDVVARWAFQDGQLGDIGGFIEAGVGEITRRHQPGRGVLASAQAAYQVIH